MNLPSPKLKLSFEFLELSASLFAPPGGAVLWRYDGQLRVALYDGEPLTVDEAYALVTKPRKRVEVANLPGSIEAVYDGERAEIAMLPSLQTHHCKTAVASAMQSSDCVDRAT